jgi:predicted RNA binding protein YcfA (HicA-like mRNA interferase family)
MPDYDTMLASDLPRPPSVRASPCPSEIIKLIEADGWSLVAARGSHRQYKHPVKPGRVTIGGKPSADLPPGTERSIVKTGRADPEEHVISYAVVIERAGDGGYGAWCPDLPGCVALGSTETETLEEMRRAIQRGPWTPVARQRTSS